MTIDKIRNDLNNKLNDKFHFIYNGARNQIEEFEGKIVNLYNYVFIVKVDDTEIKKSFSYTDILIGNLVVCKKM